MHLTSEQLAQVKAACARLRVRGLALFGSALAEHLSPGGDLDLAVAFRPDVRVGAFSRCFDFKAELKCITHRAVDPISLDSVRNPHFQTELAESKVEYATWGCSNLPRHSRGSPGLGEACRGQDPRRLKEGPVVGGCGWVPTRNYQRSPSGCRTDRRHAKYHRARPPCRRSRHPLGRLPNPSSSFPA